jgi:ABC-type dipeptide/oligopeptide/nickel transport system permease component
MSLLRYVLRRIAILVPVIIGVTFLTFATSRLIVPDPARAWAGLRASPSTLEAYAIRYHLRDPVYVQYLYFLYDLIRGDWGTSPVNGQPILPELMRYFPATVELALASLLITVLLSLGLGVLAASKRERWQDRAVRLFSLGTYSFPPFLLALLMQLIFFYALGLFPSGGRLSPDIAPPPGITGLYLVDSLMAGNFTAFKDALLHIIMPSATLALTVFGLVTRLIRSSMIDALQQDYIRTARAKGLGEAAVLFKHALRNAAIPALTALSLIFAYMLGGAIVVEYIFNWPGIGRFAVQSALSLDLPAVMGATILYALSVSLLNLLADVGYALLDPRIRLVHGG